MKILFYSRLFFPERGGSVSIVDQLSDAWIQLGNEVTVWTPARGGDNSPEEQSLSYQVQRERSFWAYLSELLQADVLVSMEMSLKAVLPAILLRKRCLVTHQTWYCLEGNESLLPRRRRLQRWLLRFVVQLPCSRTVGENWGGKFQVVRNPYREKIYHDTRGERPYDFCFVGRLVNDKGVDLFIESLALLKSQAWEGKAIVVGEGEEREIYQQLCQEAGLTAQVEFVGWKSTHETAEILNQSRIMVVPSRWPEPFGMVAVEGLACGCRMIVSSGGGLPEAAGPFALTFKNGNLKELSNAMKRLLHQEDNDETNSEDLAAHLQQFEVLRVAQAYLNLTRT